MRNSFSLMVAILATVLAGSPLFAASSMKESATDSGIMDRERSPQDLEEMKGSIRSMIGELAKNKLLLQEMTKEMLKEASRNKEVLKEVIRGIAQNREMVKAIVKDLIADEEIQKALRENRELLRELLDELSKKDVSDKADDKGK